MDSVSIIFRTVSSTWMSLLAWVVLMAIPWSPKINVSWKVCSVRLCRR